MTRSPGGEPRRLRTLGLRALQLLLTVAVTWFILARLGVSLEEVRALDPAAWRPDLPLLALASLVLLAGYILSAILWGVMVAELGGPRLPPAASCRIYFLSNLARYVPGKVWQLASLAWLAHREGVPAGVSSSAAVLGHAMALGGAALVGSWALFQGGERFRVLGVLALLGVVLPLLVLTLPPVFRKALRVALRLLRRPPQEPPVIGPGFGIRWLTLYAVNWGVYSIGFWALVRSFQLGGGAADVASAFAAAYLLGYLAVFAPAGLGVREGFLIALLQPAHGVAAVGMAVIARLWTVVVEILPALAFAGAPWLGGKREHRTRAP